MNASPHRKGRTVPLRDKPSPPLFWLLSAYHANSHAAWARRLTNHFRQIQWRQITLPGRHFRWRIRGNPLSWLDTLPDEKPDLILATSMVDLATIKGLHPRLVGIPTIYYFHENQFVYPRSDRQHDSVDPQMVQLYGALAAEHIAFNSAFNRDSFLQGVDELLQRLPDAVPEQLVQRLAEKAVLCPVPLEPPETGGERDPNLILWNHRWKYDKNPDLFAAAILELGRQRDDFRLALLGPRPGRPMAALDRLRQRMSERIVVDERVNSADYNYWLGRTGIVVSTAIHEFQGLSVLEAVAAGALPLVPDALCYPEQYPSPYRYPPGDRAALVEQLNRWLDGDRPPPAEVSNWFEQSIWEKWRQLLM